MAFQGIRRGAPLPKGKPAPAAGKAESMMGGGKPAPKVMRAPAAKRPPKRAPMMARGAGMRRY